VYIFGELEKLPKGSHSVILAPIPTSRDRALREDADRQPGAASGSPGIATPSVSRRSHEAGTPDARMRSRTSDDVARTFRMCRNDHETIFGGDGRGRRQAELASALATGGWIG